MWDDIRHPSPREELLHDPRELRGCYGENSAAPLVLPCQFPFK